MRRLYWALVLPLFLLFAQQGELRHEYSHYAEALTASQTKAPVDSDHCQSCLAYAHLSGVAKTEVAATALLADVTFHFAPAIENAGVAAEAASPRSRGPPSV
jgi:hypothetical protein